MVVFYLTFYLIGVGYMSMISFHLLPCISLSKMHTRNINNSWLKLTWLTLYYKHSRANFCHMGSYRLYKAVRAILPPPPFFYNLALVRLMKLENLSNNKEANNAKYHQEQKCHSGMSPILRNSSNITDLWENSWCPQTYPKPNWGWSNAKLSLFSFSF